MTDVAEDAKRRTRQGRRLHETRDRQDDRLCGADRVGCAHLRLRALQYPLRLDGADPLRGRLPLRLEVLLWLQPHSFPFGRRSSPAASSASQPQRGDVVGVQAAGDPASDYIKRLIGLPGDRIQVIDGQLYVNDRPAKRNYTRRLRRFVQHRPSAVREMLRRKHALPSSRSASVLEIAPQFASPTPTTPAPTSCRPHLFHDGRQPRQLARQPVRRCRRRTAATALGRLRARGESGRHARNSSSFRPTAGRVAVEPWKWPLAIRYDRLFSADPMTPSGSDLDRPCTRPGSPLRRSASFSPRRSRTRAPMPARPASEQ